MFRQESVVSGFQCWLTFLETEFVGKINQDILDLFFTEGDVGILSPGGLISARSFGILTYGSLAR